MEIAVNKRDEMECEFNDLKPGECFKYDKGFFIRAHRSASGPNAMSLATNALWTLGINTPVRRVRRAVLTIDE